jgi:cytochrome c biogenesis protein ResB
MDLAFRVGAFYPHYQLLRSFSPEPNTAASLDVFPTIQLEIDSGAGKEYVWLAKDFRTTVDLPNAKFHFLYGDLRKPLGFRLKLRDFRVEHYPGTNSPASFESDVTLLDDARGISRDVTISMNQPLEHKGFRIYQSGYSQPEGAPEISIFSVGRDPGIPLKYLGAIVIVTGMLIMFYIRKFSSAKETQ